MRELRRWNKSQERQRRQALKEYGRLQFRVNAASLDDQLRVGGGRSYDDRPLVDRVLAFRGSVFRFIFGTLFFLFWNVATR